MAGQVETRLAELGITLPRPMAPIANYVPYVVTGNLVVISGQLPAVDGQVAVTGKVSWGVSADKAKDAARLCFINLLVHLKVFSLILKEKVTKVKEEESLEIFL